MWKVSFFASIGEQAAQPLAQIDVRSVYRRVIVGSNNLQRFFGRHRGTRKAFQKWRIVPKKVTKDSESNQPDTQEMSKGQILNMQALKVVKQKLENILTCRLKKLRQTFYKWRDNTESFRYKSLNPILRRFKNRFLSKALRVWHKNSLFNSEPKEETGKYSPDVECIDQGLIYTQALIAKQLEMTLRKQQQTNVNFTKGNRVHRILLRNRICNLSLSFNQWSVNCKIHMAYKEKLRLADQLGVVHNERRDLEEKVRYVQDSNEGKERMIEMLSQQSDGAPAMMVVCAEHAQQFDNLHINDQIDHTEDSRHTEGTTRIKSELVISAF